MCKNASAPSVHRTNPYPLSELNHWTIASVDADGPMAIGGDGLGLVFRPRSGENNSHHQSRADAVLYSSCIDPCSCSKRMGFNISSPSFCYVHNSFDMGSQVVLQVLNRSGQENVARTPTRFSCCAATMDGQISAPPPFGQALIGDELLHARMPQHALGFQVLYPHPQLGSKPLSRSSLQSTHGRLGEHQFSHPFPPGRSERLRWVAAGLTNSSRPSRSNANNPPGNAV